jgi:XTP/dITP diphosphohydrolase
MQLIFATHNPNKVKEIQSVLPEGYTIQSLAEINYTEPIEEPFETIEENSAIKATTIFENTKLSCFSEDTGLIVPSLGGAPGVYSARYAGEHASNKDNIDLLLKNLNNNSERNAYFKTVITLQTDTEQATFSGECHGKILLEPIGENGFGYDAVFQPDGSEISFAQMSMEEKNKFSHRKKAMAKLLDYLAKNYK